MMNQIKKLTLPLCMLLGSSVVGMQAANAVPVAVDAITVVDESGSMGGEHAWLAQMIPDLEAALVAANVGTSISNQYGLTGYGATPSHGVAGHKHSVGGGDFGTDAQYVTATGTLVTTGGTEDGWEAIDFALNNYTFRGNAATQIILATDEDRDNIDGTLTFNGILNALNAQNALLNVVVDASFQDGTGTTALGIDADGNAYIADGSGGFTKTAGGIATSGFGTTIADYVDLAIANGGAAWDLNQLRAGGLTAESFSNAFVAIKVQEIQQQQPIPEPASIALLGAGLAGIGVIRRRQRKS